MIIAINRQDVPTVGEASKTIARSLLSPSLLAQLIAQPNLQKLVPIRLFFYRLQKL